MSKRKQPRLSTPPAPATAGTFTNSLGKTFKIHGLPPLVPQKIEQAVEREWREAHNGKIPTPPLYKVVNVAGEEELHPHDEKTTKNKKEQAEWIQYISEKEVYDTIRSNRLMKRVTMCVDVTPDDLWRAEYEATIGALPTNPFEVKMEYIETEVLASAEDVMKLMTSVMRLTGMVNEEAIDAAEATFRSSVEKATAELASRG
jgi:hypothetical protein